MTDKEKKARAAEKNIYLIDDITLIKYMYIYFYLYI